ncbi:MarR family winged helix-turn-helix transcriptional regulator [Actinophytocola sp.]|uniref:MarR family winged helix-turn-helix transcriptional regulator n=1 Tax=Actinophytocola sp. TaxID=1872138 RepID=UPI002D801EC0|nr:MarR family transcriptional regulator [Actinophytocola sp.]HET9139591.1 MarR family transcriptional regulator [Actinophytocola sp.]
MTSPADAPTQQVPQDVLERFGRIGREMSTMTVLFHSRVAEQMGLSGTDHKCLELVIRAPAPLTAGQIAQQSGLSTGAVTGVIDRLERRGFVHRVRDPHDRRKVLVESSGFDESRYQHLFSDMVKLTERVLARFTPEEREVLERYNRAMVEEYTRLLDER